MKEEGILKETMKRVSDRAMYYIERITEGKAETGIVMFTNELGILAQTDNVKGLLKEIKEN